jgi:hypothetical protein
MRIAHSRWSHALIAGLLLAGCKSNKDKEPVPPAQASATPAAPAPKPAAPAPAPTPAPVSDATLSFLEESRDGKCRWEQQTPPGEPRTVFTLSSDCGGVKLAWSPDGKEGLVHVAAQDEDGKPGTWRVELATGKATPLPLPTLGTLGGIGFDAQGRPLALMEDPLAEEGLPSHLKVVKTGEGEKETKEILFEGKRYPMALDGIPGLAHAFRLEGGAWKRIETKDTSYGWDYAADIRALDAYDAMGPTPEKLEAAGREAFKPVAEDAPELAQLNAVQQTSDSGAWKQLETLGGPLYAWESAEGEFATLSMPVRVKGEKGLLEPEGVELREAISVSTRGEWVLFRGQGSEDENVARLWNVKTKKLVTSLLAHKQVTFWPKPSGSAATPPAPVAGPTPP